MQANILDDNYSVKQGTIRTRYVKLLTEIYDNLQKEFMNQHNSKADYFITR